MSFTLGDAVSGYIAPQVLTMLVLISVAVISLQLLSITGHKIYQNRRSRLERRVRAAFDDAIVDLIADDADEHARSQFITLLPQRHDERDVIATMLLEVVPKVRGAAREGILQLLDEAGFTEQYLVRLSTKSPRHRAIAAEVLGTMRAHSALPGLLRLLNARNEELRVVAARALGKLGNPLAVQPLIDAFVHGRLPLGTVASSIIQIGPAAGSLLQSSLGSPDADVRALTAELAGILRLQSSVDHLCELLTDPAVAVRRTAATALGQLANEDAIPSLVLTLQDEDVALRTRTCVALGQIGSTDALDALHNATGDPEHDVRVAATRALTQLGDRGLLTLAEILLAGEPLAVPYVIEALQSSGFADRMAKRYLDGERGGSGLPSAVLRALAESGGLSTLRQAAIAVTDAGELAPLTTAGEPALPADADSTPRVAVRKGPRHRLPGERTRRPDYSPRESKHAVIH